MPCFVTGIVPTSDVSELEKVLGGVANVDHSKLSVITKSQQTDDHESSFLNFIHAGAEAIDTEAIGHIGGDSIMTGSGGTGVPGMNSTMSALGYFGHPHVIAAIGALPIPEDEAANYNDALEAGRSVVAYSCDASDSGAIEAAMHTAGVKHVKTFKG